MLLLLFWFFFTVRWSEAVCGVFVDSCEKAEREREGEGEGGGGKEGGEEKKRDIIEQWTLSELSIKLLKNEENFRERYYDSLFSLKSKWSDSHAFIDIPNEIKIRHEIHRDLLKNNQTTTTTTNDKDISSSSSSLLLAYVPIVVKDNINTNDYRTTAATKALEHFIPLENAPVVKQLLQHGAIVFGKANMHELAFGITSHNIYYGSVRNPCNPKHTAGGSSGGTGGAVTAGFVPAGLGTDTGGSVRIPSSFGGIVGFRPTVDRYASDGVIPLSSTFDTVGPMAPKVADVILLDQVLTTVLHGSTSSISSTSNQNKKDSNVGETKNKKNWNIGVPKEYFTKELHPSVERCLWNSVKKLQNSKYSHMHISIQEQVSEFDLLHQDNLNTLFSVISYEFVRDLSWYLEAFQVNKTLRQIIDESVGLEQPALKSWLNADLRPTVKQYHDHLKMADAIQQRIVTYMDHYHLDAFLVVTSPVLPPLSGVEESELTMEGKKYPTLTKVVQNTAMTATARIPCLSIPSCRDEHTSLPIGLDLCGKPHSDELILQLGLELEPILQSKSIN